MVAYALPIVDAEIPTTFVEAVSCSKSGEWKKAMEEKMQFVTSNPYPVNIGV